VGWTTFISSFDFETDPCLVASFLQLANSVYFGSVQKISRIRRAVMQVGLEESISAVSLHFFQTPFPKFSQLEGFSGKDYWAHSWACATANRMLERPDLSTSCLPGELYIAGFLQGVGKLSLALQQPNEFLFCLQTSRDYNQLLSEAEIDQFGTTNSSIAYEILEFWQFPKDICMVVKHYQGPVKKENKVG
jgi:HD-like signal output (HDOD) protein